ncbi:MAG: cytochrome c [Acidobacteria bacterium]|nr:cytochrome c [Acidobacteriota bacterium]
MKSWIVAGVAAVLVLAVLAVRFLLREDEATPAADETGLEQAAASDDPVERGRVAYFKHCVACHSPDTDEYVAGLALKDYFNNPPTELSDGTLFPRTDGAIRELIEKGTKDMPPLMKGITPQELDDILAYLHTL